MKLLRVFALTAAVVLTTVGAEAQSSVTFTNNDGTFTYDPATTELDLGVTTGDGVLGLPNPGKLTAISGLSAFGISDNSVSFDNTTGMCSPACLGTIKLQTNTLASGSITSSATFNPGGTFTVTYTNGVTFSGTFTTAKWTQVGTGTWVFSGTVMGGTLMIGSNMYTVSDATTIQLTTTDKGYVVHPFHGNVITFQDNQGTTNFILTPEPGTLSLVGTGFLLAGLVVRRRFSSRRPGTEV